MKLLFASDIHGSAYYSKKLCCCIEKECPDKIVLLGDLLYHGPRNDLPLEYDPKATYKLLNQYAQDIIAVRGNCESEVDQMVLDFPCMADYTTIMFTNTLSAFVTHGHLWSPENLPPLSPQTIFISGHTHKKKLEKKDPIIFLNPGSVSIPKDGERSYALYDNETFRLKNLDNETLSTLEI